MEIIRGGEWTSLYSLENYAGLGRFSSIPAWNFYLEDDLPKKTRVHDKGRGLGRLNRSQGYP
ncbi:MAG: hypothetical protein ACK53L_08410, partial [Pirellulaceae bacterium]